MTIQEQIKQRIDEAEPGTVFFVNDFAEFDNEYVSKLLSTMKGFGVLERLAKGIYYKPIVTNYGNVYPSAEKIVKLIAEHENAEILPTGEYALNALGLSTQVPMKAIYLTTGSPRTITIGNKKIRLKHRTPSTYSYHSKLMPLLAVGELGGSYQEKNANTVLTAAMQLYNKGIIKNAESIAKGFSNVCELTGLMGRWQKLQATPLVICDTGHNVGGWTYLSQQIKRQQCKQKRIVFGMVDDKDLHAVMSMLPDDAIYYWTQPSTHRAFPVENVAETADDYDLHGKVFPTVLEAYQAALQDADEQDFIFVGGSSYVVADLLTNLQKK